MDNIHQNVAFYFTNQALIGILEKKISFFLSNEYLKIFNLVSGHSCWKMLLKWQNKAEMFPQSYLKNAKLGSKVLL